MRFGPFDITVCNHGFFRLDGGAMFGTVPKAIWSKLSPPDDENRILLAARSLIIRTGEHVVMVDAGMGDRWTDKLRRIYDIRPVEGEAPGLDPASVTDVILTHLHFDHARGIFQGRSGDESAADPRYPEARIHVQAANYETAKAPNARERASYIAEDTKLLERTRLVLASGSREIAPGVRVHATNGHTAASNESRSRATGGHCIPFGHRADLAPPLHDISTRPSHRWTRFCGGPSRKAGSSSSATTRRSRPDASGGTRRATTRSRKR
jgi:hypothetical protein